MPDPKQASERAALADMLETAINRGGTAVICDERLGSVVRGYMPLILAALRDREAGGRGAGTEEAGAKAPSRLTTGQRLVLIAIKHAPAIAGNDEGWVRPPCPRPTLAALERRRLIERRYDALGVISGAGMCRLTEAGRAATFTLRSGPTPGHGPAAGEETPR